VKSVWITYLVIFVYYLLGTIGIYFINRKKDPVSRYKAWEKHIIFFLLVNILFFSIAIRQIVFRYTAALIIAVGFSELLKLFIESGYRHKFYSLTSLLIFVVFSGGFFVFSGMGQGLILFSFLILCIFDGFSQVTGQLLGKRKLFPRVSPNKTVEGLAGGSVVAVLSALVFKDIIPADTGKALITAAVVVFFAFAGDALKSLYKRKYNVKDFSKLIPGHGGFLDRFDSLIAGGAGVALLGLIFSLLGPG
jgi:phosphatidate cytidylyltransferase